MKPVSREAVTERPKERKYGVVNTLALIAKVFTTIAVVAVGLIAVVLVVDIIIRYFGLGLHGLTEVGVFLMVVITFLTFPYITLIKGHLRIPILYDKFSVRAQKSVNLALEVLSLFVLVMLAYAGAKY